MLPPLRHWRHDPSVRLICVLLSLQLPPQTTRGKRSLVVGFDTPVVHPFGFTLFNPRDASANHGPTFAV